MFPHQAEAFVKKHATVNENIVFILTGGNIVAFVTCAGRHRHTHRHTDTHTHAPPDFICYVGAAEWGGHVGWDKHFFQRRSAREHQNVMDELTTTFLSHVTTVSSAYETKGNFGGE